MLNRYSVRQYDSRARLGGVIAGFADVLEASRNARNVVSLHGHLRCEVHDTFGRCVATYWRMPRGEVSITRHADIVARYDANPFERLDVVQDFIVRCGIVWFHNDPTMDAPRG